jgi:competence protein ComFC
MLISGNMTRESLIQLIKDYIFPIFCLGCHQEGVWLCESCLRSIDVSGVYFCPLCNMINDTGEPCRRCADDNSLARSSAVARLSTVTPLSSIIHHLKYRYVVDVDIYIGELISGFLANNYLEDIDLIIPVPLHPRRMRERGFNQSEMIARLVADGLGVPMRTNIVERARYTKPQIRLGREKRQLNLMNAFRIVDGTDSMDGLRILLIDDVYTSGATMRTLAETLMEAGASRVIGLTLAKGSFSRSGDR